MPSRPYHSLVLPGPASAPASAPVAARASARAALPRVAVERRELSAYAAFAAGGES